MDHMAFRHTGNPELWASGANGEVATLTVRGLLLLPVFQRGCADHKKRPEASMLPRSHG